MISSPAGNVRHLLPGIPPALSDLLRWTCLIRIIAAFPTPAPLVLRAPRLVVRAAFLARHDANSAWDRWEAKVRCILPGALAKWLPGSLGTVVCVTVYHSTTLTASCPLLVGVTCQFHSNMPQLSGTQQ